MGSYKFGKLPKKVDHRTFSMAKYLAGPALLPPLEEYDVLLDVEAKIGPIVISSYLPMDGNGPDPTLTPPLDPDGYGDCVEVAHKHKGTVDEGLLGNIVVPTATEVVTDYLSRTGGQDTGLVMLDFLKSLKAAGLILGFAEIMDPTDHTLVQQALSLFKGLVTGIDCWEGIEDQFQAGTWTGGTDADEGHGIFNPNYDRTGIGVSTWGGLCKMIWPCWDQYAVEVYAIIPVEAKNPAYAPGFDVDLFMTDLALVGQTNL